MAKHNMLTVYFPDGSHRKRWERQADRFGITASSLIANVLEAVLPIVEATPDDEGDPHKRPEDAGLTEDDLHG